MLSYGPNQFEVIYIGLPELKVTVHGPDAQGSKVWAGKEVRRRFLPAKGGPALGNRALPECEKLFSKSIPVPRHAVASNLRPKSTRLGLISGVLWV
jgi:hypothetical protein